MTKFGVIEDTLFIPMLGRIYASEHFPKLFYDKKSLSLKEKLPSNLLKQGSQNQYTLLASASRSSNMDRCILDYLRRRPGGVIIQLGCGLETAYYRNDNGNTHWYAVDLPHVIAYRKELLPKPDRETYLSGDAFEEGWIRQVRAAFPDAPLLVTASGFFYYFEKEKIICFLQKLQQYGEIEVVFDAVSKSGLTMMQRKYMKKVGHANAQMHFYVNAASQLASSIGKNTKVLVAEPYYRHIDKTGLNLSTKLGMNISDLLGMVKVIHLEL